MKFDILNRWSGQIQYTADIDANELTPQHIRTARAFEWGHRNGADLAGAVFSGAHFLNADVNGAKLNGADLSNTNLRRINLSNANLEDANLTGADMTFAQLDGARLCRCNLVYADLHYASLEFANFADADLRHADLTGLLSYNVTLKKLNLNKADLRNADIRDARAPYIHALDSKILAALRDGASLDMADWQASETRRSRGAWAIYLAGDAGRTLQTRLGSLAAAAFIYATAYPSMAVPDFFAGDAEAVADMNSRAHFDLTALNPQPQPQFPRRSRLD